MNKIEQVQQIVQYKSEIDTIIHSRYHELAQNYNLTIEQFNLLIELDELMIDVFDEFNAPTIGQIAKDINNSQNTVSERISRLENKGLVKRVKDQNDKRISRVVLTDAGRKLISDIEVQADSKFLFNSISNMNDEDINKLNESLKKLVDQMKINS